jgi:hypothetical protein
VGELAQILHAQRKALNHIHVGAAWVCLARIGTGHGGGGGRDVVKAVATLQDRTRVVLGVPTRLPQGRAIANSMHSMAKFHTMGMRADRGLLQAMQRRATATVGEFKPQEVSNVLWALATMGERADRGLLEAMQRRATATAGGFKPQDVANVLWALATMGERADRGLLEAIHRRATATAGEFKPQGIANVLWALATMGERADRGLLEAMQRRVTATSGDFKPQDVTNVLWALSAMGEGLGGSLVVLIDCLAVRVLSFRDQFIVKERSQLHQWLLSCEFDVGSGASLPSSILRVKQEMREECLQAFTGQATHESGLQRDVADALRGASLNAVFEEEFRDARSVN